MSEFDLNDGLDMEMDIDEVELSPEYVDVTPGIYQVRIAGITKREFTMKNKDGDEIDALSRNIVCQIVGLESVDLPAPEVGGVFSFSFTMDFDNSRSQFIRAIKKAVKLANPEFIQEKHTVAEYLEEVVRLYDKEHFLAVGVSLRNDKYPELKSMRYQPAADVELSEEFPYCEIEIDI